MRYHVAKGVYKKFSTTAIALVLAINSLAVTAPVFLAQPVHAIGGSTAIADADYVVDGSSAVPNGTVVSGKPTYQTIAAAVTAAATNTVIVVRDGTYVENVSLSVNGKSLALKAEHKHQAIIKGNVLIKWNGPYTLDGFTIESPNPFDAPVTNQTFCCFIFCFFCC